MTAIEIIASKIPSLNGSFKLSAEKSSKLISAYLAHYNKLKLLSVPKKYKSSFWFIYFPFPQPISQTNDPII